MLVFMLRLEIQKQDRLQVYIDEAVDEVIKQITDEYGLGN